MCSFSVAVNRRGKTQGQQETDYFRVSAWNQLGENCSKYLAKGRKVAVVGSVSVSTYKSKDGEYRANMEVLANDIEFLSAKSDTVDKQTGYTKVDPAENPFNEEASESDVPY